MINFNGADNITINGINSGGNSLTISNTTASSTFYTSIIHFSNGAANNQINNCTIWGSYSGGVAVFNFGGTISFVGDNQTSNGNDNNRISNCNIGPAGGNLPSCAIYGNGNTANLNLGNSNHVISNNNIYDYFASSNNSAGIYTSSGCNSWTITNNKFYQPSNRSFTGTYHNTAIGLAGLTLTMKGSDVSGNIIGYNSNSQTGTYTLIGSSGKFIGIQYYGIDGGSVTNTMNNTIAIRAGKIAFE